MTNPDSKRILQALGLEFSSIVALPNVFVSYTERYRNMVKEWDIVAIKVFATAESPYAPIKVRKKSHMARGLTIKSYCDEHGCDYDPSPRLRVLGVRNLITGESLIFDLDSMGLPQIHDLLASVIDGKIVVVSNATHALAWISHATEDNYSARPFFTVDPVLYVRMFFSPRVPEMKTISEKSLCARIGAEIDGAPCPYVPWMPEFLDSYLYRHAQTFLEATDKLMRWVAGDSFCRANMEALKDLDYAQDADAYVRGLVGIHLRGMSLHVPRIKKVLTDSLDDCERSMGELLETLPELAEFQPQMSNPDFSPNEKFREKFLAAIYERFQATVVSFAAADLKNADVPIAGAWGAFIKSGKKYSYFASIYDAAHDGRIYPLPAINAVTGRVSARFPNILSLPKTKPEESVIIPRQGSVFLRFDYSQIEIRIAAAVAVRALRKRGKEPGKSGLVAALNAGADIHHVTALACRGSSAALEDYMNGSRAQDEDRRKAKAVNFGLLFGMGDASLQRYCLTNYDVEISADEAKLFRIAWYGAYPELAFWHDVTRKAKRGGSWLVRTLSNRPIVAKTLTGAYNYACQGSCVDICARAFRLFESAPANISRYVVGFKFDEFMFEVPEFTVLKMRPIIEECMIQAAHGFLWPFGIPAGDVGFSLQKEAKDD